MILKKGIIIFGVVSIGGFLLNADPTVTLSIAAAAAFGTIIVSPIIRF